MTENEIPEFFRDLKTIDPEKEIVFCKNCTMSNQRPRIQFNEKGICSACVYNEYKNKIIDWDKREKELEILCDKHRKEDGTWDVIVPSSGGKDSSYVSYILKEKYGMNPLTVTWAPAVPTIIGQENLFNMCYTGQDNVLFTPNGKLHRHLTRLAFLNLLHPFQPFIIGQKNIGPRIASKFNISLIIYGENTSEYGSSIEENFNPIMEQKYFTNSRSNLFFGKKKEKSVGREK